MEVAVDHGIRSQHDARSDGPWPGTRSGTTQSQKGDDI